MKNLLCVFLLFASPFCYSQDAVQDLSKSVCKCLDEYKDLYDDSSIIDHCYQLAIKQTPGLPKSTSQLEKIILKVDGQLQKTCKMYMEIGERLSPQQGDWEKLDSNLNTKLDSTGCRQLLAHKTLYYLEHSGDTTMLVIKDGLWTDMFPKGTYSKCYFRWTTACDFELEFIKSNDPSRKNLSNAGDKYYYRIIEKTADYYLLTVHYVDLLATFKIYYKD